MSAEVVVMVDRRLSGAVEWGWPVDLVVDGAKVPAFEGECVAVALRP